MNKNLPFEMRELTGVSKFASVPLVLVSPPDIAAKNVQEFVALVKSKPGTMNFSSAGIASAAYLAADSSVRRRRSTSSTFPIAARRRRSAA